jgi:hypothetical protein
MGDNIRMDDVNRVGSFGMHASGSGYGPMAGPREHDNEPSGSIKIQGID